MEGLEGGKFSKMLYRKCSENHDYRYTVSSPVISSGIFRAWLQQKFLHKC